MNLNRRHLFAAAGALAGLAATRSFAQGLGTAWPMGIQLWTVGAEMQKDGPGTLRPDGRGVGGAAGVAPCAITTPRDGVVVPRQQKTPRPGDGLVEGCAQTWNGPQPARPGSTTTREICTAASLREPRPGCHI